MLLDEFRARVKALDKSIVDAVREFQEETKVRVTAIEAQPTSNGDVFKVRVDL